MYHHTCGCPTKTLEQATVKIANRESHVRTYDLEGMTTSLAMAFGGKEDMIAHLVVS